MRMENEMRMGESGGEDELRKGPVQRSTRGPSLRCITHLLSFFTISFLKRLSRWYGDDDDEHDIWASSLANLVEPRLLAEYLSVT